MTHSFIVVGTRIINLDMITYVDSNSSEGEGMIEINLLDGSTLYFEKEEASLVSRLFLPVDDSNLEAVG